MKRIILAIIVLSALALLDSSIATAQYITKEESLAAGQSEAVNVGNKICPVSADKIKEETKAIFEYKGKDYNFCCPVCIETFKEDPEKYIKKVEEELQKEKVKEESEGSSEVHGHGEHSHMHH